MKGGNIFASIGATAPKKSQFNLSHQRKFSFEPGKLVPTLCREVIPSDVWDFSCSAVVRLQPTIAPIMHQVDTFNYSFFIPNRLSMGEGLFEVFITGGPNGDGKTAAGVTVQIPYINVVNVSTGAPNPPVAFHANTIAGPGSLLDYLGFNRALTVQASTTPQSVSMLPVLAFWRVWCEYFRDQNLHPDYVSLYPGIFNAQSNIGQAIVDAQDDPDNPFQIFVLPNVCWEKDYFMSALPFAQRGQPVEAPLTGPATVTYLPQSDVKLVSGGVPTDGALLSDTGKLQVDDALSDQNARIENIDEVNLGTGGFSINALRLAARVQEWLEKMARGGARYIEQMWSHFRVRSSDARLQRSEYLAGGRIPVHISEVLQTAPDPLEITPMGDMSGHGIAAGNMSSFKKFFEEHGFIISVTFMRPRTAYQQGLDRMWTNRFDKLDWAWPTFAHLGEQVIKRKEIFWAGNPADEDDFGYQQRYAEYKYIPSSVHGQFKTTLDFWHWGMIFQTEPTLSPEFVTCDPDPRVFNVMQSDFDKCYCIVNNIVTAVRPLPYYGQPSL